MTAPGRQPARAPPTARASRRRPPPGPLGRPAQPGPAWRGWRNGRPRPAARSQPDVALLDIGMPGPDGIEVARRLTANRFRGKIVIVTTFGRPGYLAAAMAAGASGFLLKDAPAAELATAIRRVHAGERVVDPALAPAAPAEGASPLTARAAQVLAPP